MNRPALSRHQREELANYGNTMDAETAGALSRAHAVLKLLADYATDARADGPMPDVLPDGIEAARLIVHGAMVRAGVAE